MEQHKNLLLVLLLVAGSWLYAAPVSYSFCIKSDDFPSFRAMVAFRAVDFGENAAKQMVIKRIKPHLKGDFEVSVYDPETCPCGDDCPLLEVTAEDWDGNINEAEASTIMGAAAESLDLIIYNAREIFNNPGGFLKKTFFSSKGEDAKS